MEPTTWWLLGLTVLVVSLCVLVALDLRKTWNRTASSEARRLVGQAVREIAREPDQPPAGAAGASMPDAEPVTAAMRNPDAELIAPPPMIGGDTLRDWLIHYRKAPEAWTDVTREFYRRAAGAPEVADYFAGVDWQRLQRHFTAALILLTHTGVTRGMPATAAQWHAEVRNTAGDPITPEIYDAVIQTLVDVLRDFGVPEDALAQLGRTVAPFRMAIARVPVMQAELVTPIQDPIDRLIARGVDRFNAQQRAAWPEQRDDRPEGS